MRERGKRGGKREREREREREGQSEGEREERERMTSCKQRTQKIAKFEKEH